MRLQRLAHRPALVGCMWLALAWLLAVVAMTFPATVVAGVWSGPARLAGPLAGDRGLLGRLPTVAVNRRGQSLVAWSEEGGHGVSVVVGDVRGRFGRAVVLSSTGARPVAAIADDGTAVVLWEDRGPSVMAAVRSPSGRFGRPERISGTSCGLFYSPVVAFNRRGNALVAWTLAFRGRESQVEVVSRPAGGRFSSPSSLGTGLGVRVALNARGDAVASWTQVVETGGRFPVPYSRTSVAQVAVRRAGGRFGTPVTVSSTPTSATTATISNQGTVAVAWERANGPETDPYGAIQTSAQLTGGAFETPVDAPFVNARRSFGPMLAGGSQGELVTLWREKARGVPTWKGAPLYWATRRPGGTFGPRRTLTTTAVTSPQLASTGDGRALIVWTVRRFGAALYRSGTGFAAITPPAGRPAPAAQSLAAAGGFAAFAWQTTDRRLVATVRRP